MEWNICQLIFNIDNKFIKCQFWDISGDPSYLKIAKTYLRDNAGIIIVFDKSNKRSFTNIKKWIKLLGNETTKILLLGNKCDKKDIQVTNYEASLFASNNNYLYADTSAKTGQNIVTSIERLIQNILLNNNLIDHPGIRVGYDNDIIILPPIKRSNCCCKFM